MELNNNILIELLQSLHFLLNDSSIPQEHTQVDPTMEILEFLVNSLQLEDDIEEEENQRAQLRVSSHAARIKLIAISRWP